MRRTSIPVTAAMMLCLANACAGPDGSDAKQVESLSQPLVTNYNVLVIRRALSPLPAPAADLSNYARNFRQKWQQVSFGRVDLSFTVSPVLVGGMMEACTNSGATDFAVIQRDALRYAAGLYNLPQFQHVIIMPHTDFTTVAKCNFSNSGGRNRFDFPGGSYDGGLYLDVDTPLQYARGLSAVTMHEFGHGYVSAGNGLIAHTELVRCPGPAYQYSSGNPTTAAVGCQTWLGSPIDFMGLLFADASGSRLQDNRFNFSGGKKFAFGWLDERHVVWGAGSSELSPVDAPALRDGVYLHRYAITPDRSHGYIVEYKKSAPALTRGGLGGPDDGGGVLPGVYVYVFSNHQATSKLLSTEPARADTYSGVAPVAIGVPRLIDASLNLYLTVHSVGETAKVTFGPPPSLQVAGTSDGDLLFSHNSGSTWAKATVPSPSGVGEITYGNERFIATGYDGSLWTSGDAQTWRHTKVSTNNWYTTTTCNGRHYVGGGSGRIASSLDGDTWTLGSPNAFGSGPIFGSACGNNIVVMVGEGGRLITTNQTGPDPQWTTRYFQPPRELHAAAFGGGTFVAVGSYGTILWSDDGIVWTRAAWPENSYFKSVTYGDGRFLAVGHDGALGFSDDRGRTWHKVAGFPDPTDYLLSATYHPRGKRFLVGALAGKVWWSDDRGNSWTKVTADPLSANIQGIASGP